MMNTQHFEVGEPTHRIQEPSILSVTEREMQEIKLLNDRGSTSIPAVHETHGITIYWRHSQEIVIRDSSQPPAVVLS